MPFILCRELNTAKQAGDCPSHLVPRVVSNPSAAWDVLVSTLLATFQIRLFHRSQSCSTASCLWGFNQSDMVGDEIAQVLDLFIN